MSSIQIALEVTLVGVAALGAIADLWKRKIFDWITYPALISGLGLQFAGFGVGSVFGQGLLASIFGAGSCTLVFGLFFLWGRGLGGGDVKLMAAVGSLAGFLPGLTCAMCVAIAGGVLALLFILASDKRIVIFRDFLRRLFRSGWRGRERGERLTIPYGLAIFLGVAWATLIRHGILDWP